jgi:hypothetical protein
MQGDDGLIRDQQAKRDGQIEIGCLCRCGIRGIA